MKIIQVRRGWFLAIGLVVFCGILPASFALRDPTQPALTAADLGSEGDLMVTMTMVSKESATANVNGKMVKVGDEVNGTKVVAIKRNVVVFRTTNNVEFSVPLHRYVAKKNLSNAKGGIHEGKK